MQILILLVLMSSVPAVFGQSYQPPPNSAQSSPNSGTGANESERPGTQAPLPANAAHGMTDFRASHSLQAGSLRSDGVIAACAATAEDLKATRVLAALLESENRLLKTRLETERQTNKLLLELSETRKSETEALRSTVAAKNETIAAKDAVIASQDKFIETLKRKKSSPWKRLGDVLIGVAIFAILK